MADHLVQSESEALTAQLMETAVLALPSSRNERENGHFRTTFSGDVYTDITALLKFGWGSSPRSLITWNITEREILTAELRQSPLGLEFRAELQTDHGTYPVRFPMHLVDEGVSPTVVIRYTGNRLDLLLFGIVVHQFGVATGSVDGSDSEVAIHAEPAESRVERLLLWDRALSDDEIESLFRVSESAAKEQEMIRRNQDQAWQKAMERAAKAPHRPAFHVLPEANWINDPNGLISWKGKFHVFYQHNPYGPYWGTMHWGHAESEDFVYWTHCPIALVPEWNSPDRDGCFSGCCVGVDGKPTIFYTAVYPEVQCAAESDDSLTVWKKLETNPLVGDPPYGEDTAGFRDPWVWREPSGNWIMIVGSGRKSTGGAIPLYRGKNPFEWEYMGDLLAASNRESGTVWECPGLIALGEKHLLVYSPEGTGKVIASLGDYADDRFRPERECLLDYGTNFYAPQATRDAAGRVVLFGWVPPGADDELFAEQAWAGCLTVPRLLETDGKGDLLIRPLPELAKLRRRHWEGAEAVARAETNRAEVLLKMKQGDADRTVLEVFRSSCGEETTRIVYNWSKQTLQVLRDRSSLDIRSHTSPTEEAFVSPLDGLVTLHVFIDRSVIEIFANERLTMTVCVYPQRKDAAGIALSSEGGDAQVESIDAWQMDSIWREPQD